MKNEGAKRKERLEEEVDYIKRKRKDMNKGDKEVSKSV